MTNPGSRFFMEITEDCHDKSWLSFFLMEITEDCYDKSWLLSLRGFLAYLSQCKRIFKSAFAHVICCAKNKYFLRFFMVQELCVNFSFISPLCSLNNCFLFYLFYPFIVYLSYVLAPSSWLKRIVLHPFLTIKRFGFFWIRSFFFVLRLGTEGVMDYRELGFQ